MLKLTYDDPGVKRITGILRALHDYHDKYSISHWASIQKQMCQPFSCPMVYCPNWYCRKPDIKTFTLVLQFSDHLWDQGNVVLNIVVSIITKSGLKWRVAKNRWAIATILSYPVFPMADLVFNFRTLFVDFRLSDGVHICPVTWNDTKCLTILDDMKTKQMRNVMSTEYTVLGTSRHELKTLAEVEPWNIYTCKAVNVKSSVTSEFRLPWDINKLVLTVMCRPAVLFYFWES